MSVSKAPFRSFVLGFVGHVPWCILYSWIGCSVGSIRDLNQPNNGSDAEEARAWGGLVALAVTAVALTFVSHRALRRAVTRAAVGDGTATPSPTPAMPPQSFPEQGNESPTCGLEL